MPGGRADSSKSSFPVQITGRSGGEIRAEDLLWDWVAWSKSIKRRVVRKHVALPLLCFGYCCPTVWTGALLRPLLAKQYDGPFLQIVSIAQFYYMLLILPTLVREPDLG